MTDAGALTHEQCEQDLITGHDAGKQITQRKRADLGRSVLFAKQIGDPGHRLNYWVKSRKTGKGTVEFLGAPVATDGGIDQFWVDLAEIVIPEPKLVY